MRALAPCVQTSDNKHLKKSVQSRSVEYALFPETEKPAVAIFPFRVRTLPFNSFLFAVWLAAARRGTTREYVRMTSPPGLTGQGRCRARLRFACATLIGRIPDRDPVQPQLGARPALVFCGVIKKQHNTLYVHYSNCWTFSFSWCFSQQVWVRRALIKSWFTELFFYYCNYKQYFCSASINKNKLQQLNRALDDFYEYRNNTGRGLHNCLFWGALSLRVWICFTC